MKRQLQVVVALAVFGASVLTANAVAGGVNLGVGGSNVSIDLPDGLGLDDLCQQLLGQGASAGTLLEAGCEVPEQPGGTDPGTGGTGGSDSPTGTPGVPSVPGIPGTPTDPGTPGEEPTPGGGKPGDGAVGEGGQGGGRGKGEVESKDKDGDGMKDDREPIEPPPPRKPDGTPTNSNPTVTVADFGPAPIGVPNFVIDSFSIPPFLLPIYQACGTEYGIPWEVLASINRIETAFGTNLNVSSAGALGWMQFIPSSWQAYGVDANNDNRKDPYNPVDAICAAANYLKAAGGQEDLPRAIFAYNHADWYVDEVLLYARQYGRIPDDLVGSLTGLTEGARFPVAADARYADDISERQAAQRAKPKKGIAGNAAEVVSASPTRRGINIYSREGAPVVAVNDGVVKKIGRSKELGRYLILEDAYGNRFTYAQLGSVADVYPVPKRQKLSAEDFELVSPGDDKAPNRAASAGSNKRKAKPKAKDAEAAPENTEDSRERLYAYPERDANLGRADLTGQLDQLLARRFPGYDSFKAAFSGILKFDRQTMEMEALHEGSKVVAGTVLGRVGKTDRLAPHLHFAIKPTGRGAPRIDPKPILDGWKLLEATAIYRAAGKNPFAGTGGSVGQILLMSKEQLIRRALADPRLEIYSCGREDIQTGLIDRRVLALLEYLTERGYRLTVTSLKCGHSYYTASGGVSHHSSGNAVDIAQINGLPVLGNQGRGSITEALVKDVLALQGTMTPDQVISLMNLGGPSFAMGDHADHVHVGFQPQYGPSASDEKQFLEILKPGQWERLIARIADIDNPDVPTKPSRYSIPTKKKKSGKQHGGRASNAHVGE